METLIAAAVSTIGIILFVKGGMYIRDLIVKGFTKLGNRSREKWENKLRKEKIEEQNKKE
jgi:hypothetical protein